MREKLTLAAIVLASLVCAAGCGGSSDEASGDETSTAVVTETATAETTTTTEVTTRNDPIRCLDAAGLSDVEERDVGVWRGLHEDPAYAVVVHKLAKPAKAPIVVAGTYAVAGSFKVAAEGEGLGLEEGLLADALVQDVAACLGG
jgi:outer membrane murein-binding lipoprotein Lpp